MATSVRMDAATERLLDRLAQERGSSKSEVIRDALRSEARRGRGARKTPRPYDAVRGIIGSIHGGPGDLSERTGRLFRNLLLQRAKKRS